MTIQRESEASPPLNELLGAALRHAADLMGSELALLRAELSANLRHLAAALSMIVVAAVFSIIALGLAVDAIVAWLTPIVGSEAIAAIVCAGGAALIATALFVAGYRRIRIDALYPDRTAASVRTDVRMIQRRMS